MRAPELIDHVLALELPELERLALQPPTFVPVWPPRAGTAWVIYLPLDESRDLAARIPDIKLFDAAVHMLPGTVWFNIPERHAQPRIMS